MALAVLVRSNTLTGAQREQTALVLGLIGSAMCVAGQADNPAAAAVSW